LEGCETVVGDWAEVYIAQTLVGEGVEVYITPKHGEEDVESVSS